jgi:serine/threonine protein phosphatase PrpC
VAVADGTGGLAGGARAAELLMDLLRDEAPSLRAATGAALSDLLVRGDARIAADARAGETTGVVLLVSDGRVVGASVGDSEAWIVTHDSVDVLTAEQIRKRAGSRAAAPTSFERRFVEGRLVVATDGLFAYSDEGRIAGVLRTCSVSDCPERLLALVRPPSGRYADDVALAVVG